MKVAAKPLISHFFKGPCFLSVQNGVKTCIWEPNVLSWQYKETYACIPTCVYTLVLRFLCGTVYFHIKLKMNLYHCLQPEPLSCGCYHLPLLVCNFSLQPWATWLLLPAMYVLNSLLDSRFQRVVSELWAIKPKGEKLHKTVHSVCTVYFSWVHRFCSFQKLCRSVPFTPPLQWVFFIHF